MKVVTGVLNQTMFYYGFYGAVFRRSRKYNAAFAGGGIRIDCLLSNSI